LQNYGWVSVNNSGPGDVVFYYDWYDGDDYPSPSTACIGVGINLVSCHN